VAFFVTAACTTNIFAQPLVTGDLSVYYSFDEFRDVVPDESSNGVLPINGHVFGKVFNSQIAVRGSGSAHFRPDISDPETPDMKDFFPDDYLDLRGAQVTSDAPELIPREAFTVAVWVNLVRYADLCDPRCAKQPHHGIYEPRSSGGSFVNHFEARSDGKLRGRIRGNIEGHNIVRTQVFIDGSTDSGAMWPDNEWFHYAQTYEKNANEGLGRWAQYYNGLKIAEGIANGGAGAMDIGDWGLGVNIGRMTDANRQLNGWMDEFYLFTRALSDAEIATLANFDPDDILRGDTDLDDAVDFDDIRPFVLALNNPELYESDFGNLAFGHSALDHADMNENGRVDFDDIPGFVGVLTSGPQAVVPEPSTCVLTIMSLLGLISKLGHWSQAFDRRDVG